MTLATEAPTSASTQADRIAELGQIIRAYSEVTEKLQQSHAQLQQTVQSLRQELSEKNRLLERKKRLTALGEMAAGMAHEIRNPLGGIQLYASMLASDVKDQPGAAQLVGKISHCVRHLEGLVSQVLHFTREVQAHPVQADLVAVVEHAVEMAGERLSGIDVSLQGPRPLSARIDPLLFSQAMLNLLLNAAEAVGMGGEIVIRWEISGDQLHLLVRDNGPGIPAEARDRIFNPFFTTKETGTGLGLAIVHRIIEAHDGTITAFNAADGSGACFEIRMSHRESAEVR